MAEMANREEIQAHVDLMNEAWQAYPGAEETKNRLLMGVLDWQYQAALRWLWNHGIREMDLRYDSETRTYSLPAPVDTGATISSASM